MNEPVGNPGESRSRRSFVLRYAIPILIFAIIAVFFRVGLELEPTYIESPLIGKAAPAFSLPGLTDPDTMVGTDDLAGQYSLLNVWATWCVECYHEHEFLVALANGGFPIYGLNWKDDRDAALDWLETLGNPYVASAFDDLGHVAIDYGVYGAPETFLVAPDLEILAKRLGVMTPEVWEREFLPAIEAHRAEQ